MRIAPYRTLENMIDGVVIVFVNITEFKTAARKLQAALHYAENIIATVREPLLVLNKKLRVVSANEAYYRTFRAGKEEVVGQLVYSLGNGEWNIPAFRTLLEEILTRGTTIEDYEVSHTFEKIGSRRMSLNARQINMAGGIFSEEEDEELILLAIRDCTEQE
jgi:PAS domain-containing protein